MVPCTSDHRSSGRVPLIQGASELRWTVEPKSSGGAPRVRDPVVPNLRFGTTGPSKNPHKSVEHISVPEKVLGSLGKKSASPKKASPKKVKKKVFAQEESMVELNARAGWVRKRRLGPNCPSVTSLLDHSLD